MGTFSPTVVAMQLTWKQTAAERLCVHAALEQYHLGPAAPNWSYTRKKQKKRHNDARNSAGSSGFATRGKSPLLNKVIHHPACWGWRSAELLELSCGAFTGTLHAYMHQCICQNLHSPLPIWDYRIPPQQKKDSRFVACRLRRRLNECPRAPLLSESIYIFTPVQRW